MYIKSIKIENVTEVRNSSDNFVYLIINEDEEYVVSYDGKINRKIEVSKIIPYKPDYGFIHNRRRS